MSAHLSALPRRSLRPAFALAAVLAACQPAPPLRLSAEEVPARQAAAAEAPVVRASWFSSPEVEPDLDDAQALTRAAQEVLRTLPDEERRRLLVRFVPFGPAPAPPDGAPSSVPDARPPVAPEGLDLSSVMRSLYAAQGSKVLALAAFFVGPERIARTRARLRLAPEHIGLGVLARLLKRYELPVLSHVRQALRWATLYGLAWPVDRSWPVTSGFGPRLHPLLGILSKHPGVDIGIPVGTEVRAPADGAVVRVRKDRVNGRWIELDHGLGVRTFFCHLSSVDVKAGQRVRAGEVVARSGDTGRVTGPHLHYQVKLSGALVDPVASRAAEGFPAGPAALPPDTGSALARPERP